MSKTTSTATNPAVNNPEEGKNKKELLGLALEAAFISMILIFLYTMGFPRSGEILKMLDKVVSAELVTVLLVVFFCLTIRGARMSFTVG